VNKKGTAGSERKGIVIGLVKSLNGKRRQKRGKVSRWGGRLKLKGACARVKWRFNFNANEGNQWNASSIPSDGGAPYIHREKEKKFDGIWVRQIDPWGWTSRFQGLLMEKNTFLSSSQLE